MASGRMEFHAKTIMTHVNVSFVLPNDFYWGDKVARHYERPAKSLILLHGLNGTDTDWMFYGPAQELAVKYNLAVFMPAVGNTFFLDRGYEGGNFCSFVGEELPQYIKKTFGYFSERSGNLIGGLSMGGYGAIHTALAFPETFSACLALSSAFVIKEYADLGHRNGDDPMPPAMSRDVFGDPERILETDANLELQYRSLKAAGKDIPFIYMACGTEDGLLESNHDFRDFLKSEGADYKYEEGPGVHNWIFWSEYIDKGLATVLDR